MRSKTALILRWMPGVDSIEKVGEYSDHDDFDHQYRYTPFPKRDSWVLGSDGRIGVISVDCYQLTWFADGKAVETGPAISFTPVRVTSAERDAFRAEKADEGAAGGGGPAQTPAARRAIGIERAKQYWGDSLFSAALPPFAERAALVSPTGDIWVRRLGPATATQLKVDILNARGALRAVLTLPPKRRLMALGANAVYMVFTDDDGFQILERYPYTAVPR
jgi:hypothetical protein